MATGRKTGGKDWAQGQSGNPAGRPRIKQTIRDMARAAAPEAFKKIAELAKSRDPKVALAASQEICNRAYGRPTERVKHSGSIGISGYLSALDAAIAARVADDAPVEDDAGGVRH